MQVTIKNFMEGYKIGPIKLVIWLMNVNVIDLAPGRSSTAEQRRITWTTYHNIKSWFENWETDLVKFGFTNCDIKGKIFISKD